MPNLFSAPATDESTPYYVVGAFAVIAVTVVIAIAVWFAWSGGNSCPKTLHQNKDGTLTLDSGEIFSDMNAFQQWWHAPGGSAHRRCPIPIRTGARRREILERDEGDKEEQMWAKTPINKVDDYEFSRIFGNERNGRMEIPQQDFNIILNQRQFDWPDKPLSSDERRSKYRGLKEGFTAAGDLKSIVMNEPTAEEIAREAVSRYGERSHNKGHKDSKDSDDDDADISCHVSREAREVAAMVAKAYEHDPAFEPVVTKVGANQWEVNELKPRRSHEYSNPVEERVVDTTNDAVDIKFRYRENKIVDDAIDPYFPDTWATPERQSKDPFYGPVPNMERMFGPTFDHKEWYKLDQGAPIM